MSEQRKANELEAGDTISCRDFNDMVATLKNLIACGYVMTADIDLCIIEIRGKHEEGY